MLEHIWARHVQFKFCFLHDELFSFTSFAASPFCHVLYVVSRRFEVNTKKETYQTVHICFRAAILNLHILFICPSCKMIFDNIKIYVWVIICRKHGTSHYIPQIGMCILIAALASLLSPPFSLLKVHFKNWGITVLRWITWSQTARWRTKETKL